MVIEELGAVVAIKAEQGEGQRVLDVFDLLEDVGLSSAPDGSLFGPAGGNIDTVNAVDEDPARDWPQWATVSASRKPGLDSSHWLVLIGICFRIRVPGLVVLLPRLVYFIRVGRRSRSMVAGEILRRASEVFEGRGPKDCP